jgi:hypothetical protein
LDDTPDDFGPGDATGHRDPRDGAGVLSREAADQPPVRDGDVRECDVSNRPTAADRPEQSDLVGSRAADRQPRDGVAGAVERPGELRRRVRVGLADGVEPLATVPVGRPRRVDVRTEHVVCAQVVLDRL